MTRSRTDNETITKEGDPARYRRVLRTLALAGISEREFASMARAYWTKGGLGQIPGEAETHLIVRKLAQAHKIAHGVFDPRPCPALRGVGAKTESSYSLECVSRHEAIIAIIEAIAAVTDEHQVLEDATRPVTNEMNRLEVLDRLLRVLDEHKDSESRITQADIAFALVVQQRIQERAPAPVLPRGANLRKLGRRLGLPFTPFGSAYPYEIHDEDVIFPIDGDELAKVYRRMKADISQARTDRKLPRDPKIRT